MTQVGYMPCICAIHLIPSITQLEIQRNTTTTRVFLFQHHKAPRSSASSKRIIGSGPSFPKSNLKAPKLSTFGKKYNIFIFINLYIYIYIEYRSRKLGNSKQVKQRLKQTTTSRYGSVIEQNQNGSLVPCYRLHAKYYTKDTAITDPSATHNKISSALQPSTVTRHTKCGAVTQKNSFPGFFMSV